MLKLFRIVTDGEVFKVQKRVWFGLCWFEISTDGWDCDDHAPDATFKTEQEATDFIGKLNWIGGFKQPPPKQQWRLVKVIAWT